MSEQTQVPTQAKEALRAFTPPEFLKQYTRDDMDGFAEQLGVDTSEHKTKSDLYNALVGAADLPDPSLRGTSDIDSPVAVTWAIADQMFAEAREKGEEPPRRKDVVQAAQDAGVTYYTARTQYQAWFNHTDRGANLVANTAPELVKDLPRGVAERLGIEVPEAEEGEDAEA